MCWLSFQLLDMHLCVTSKCFVSFIRNITETRGEAETFIWLERSLEPHANIDHQGEKKIPKNGLLLATTWMFSAFQVMTGRKKITLIKKENKKKEFDWGWGERRQKDQTVLQYLWSTSRSSLLHWRMRLMTDLTWGRDRAAGLQIRTGTASDDNIVDKNGGKKGKNMCLSRILQAAAPLPSVRGSRTVPSSSRSDRLSFITSRRASSPARTRRVHWQRNFSSAALSSEVRHPR